VGGVRVGTELVTYVVRKRTTCGWAETRKGAGWDPVDRKSHRPKRGTIAKTRSCASLMAFPRHHAGQATKLVRRVLVRTMVSCGHQGARYARVSRSGVRVAVVARVALHAWPNVGLYRTTISATRKF